MDNSSLTTNVDILAALARLDERLQRIEQRIEQAERVAPAVSAMAVDSFDDLARILQAQGVDLDQRWQNAQQTLELLTRDDTLRVAQTLLAAAQAVPGMLAMLVDDVDQ